MPAAITAEAIVETGEIMLDGAARGISAFATPRLAVAGLNPHAGEDGVLGSEEEAIIAPAIAAAESARPSR